MKRSLTMIVIALLTACGGLEDDTASPVEFGIATRAIPEPCDAGNITAGALDEGVEVFRTFTSFTITDVKSPFKIFRWHYQNFTPDHSGHIRGCADAGYWVHRNPEYPNPPIWITIWGDARDNFRTPFNVVDSQGAVRRDIQLDSVKMMENETSIYIPITMTLYAPVVSSIDASEVTQDVETITIDGTGPRFF